MNKDRSSRNWIRLAAAAVSLITAAGFLTGGGLLAGGEEDEHLVLAEDMYRIAEVGKGAYLGVQLTEELDHPEGGAKIVRVVDGSPADKAGLQKGDIIISMAGDTVRGPGALSKRIRDREPGDSVSLTVIRDDSRVTLDVELGERRGLRAGGWFLKDGEAIPFGDLEEGQLEEYREKMKEWSEKYGEAWEEYGEKLRDRDFLGNYRLQGMFSQGRPKLGVQLVEATPELREHLGGTGEAGVLVSKVVAGSAAEKAGILVGDLITAADGNAVEDSGDLVRALRDKSDEEIVLVIIRDGRRMEIEAFIEAPAEDEATGPRAFLSVPDIVMPDMPPMPPMPELPAMSALPVLPEVMVLPELPELPDIALPELEALESLELEELIHVPEMNLEVRRAVEDALRQAQEVNRELLLERVAERERLLAEKHDLREDRMRAREEAMEAYRAAREDALEQLRDSQRSRERAREAVERARRGNDLLEI